MHRNSRRSTEKASAQTCGWLMHTSLHLFSVAMALGGQWPETMKRPLLRTTSPVSGFGANTASGVRARREGLGLEARGRARGEHNAANIQHTRHRNRRRGSRLRAWARGRLCLLAPPNRGSARPAPTWDTCSSWCQLHWAAGQARAWEKALTEHGRLRGCCCRCRSGGLESR